MRLRVRFAAKVGGAIAVPLILLLAVGWVGYSSLEKVHGYVRQIATEQVGAIELASQLQAEVGLYRQWEQQHLLSTTLGEMDDYEARARSSARNIGRLIAEIKALAGEDLAGLAADIEKA